MPKPLMCPPELLARDLAGQVFLVTGANSGIGFVTAQQLAKQGARVLVGARRPDAGQAAVDAIRAAHPAAEVTLLPLDLGDLASVRAAADQVLATTDRLDGLVNNAGIMNAPEGRTVDGFESQIGVNHLGHFLLTELLTERLIASSPSRIVVLSSSYHDVAMGREGHIVLDDLHFDRRPYDGWAAYAQSKLANLLHARELARRLEGTGVTAVSVHPGWVRTNLIQHSIPVWFQNSVMKMVQGFIGMIEPWEGAQTTLYALLADDVVEHGGAFYSQLGHYRDSKQPQSGWPMKSPNPEAHDDALPQALWARSTELVGLGG